MCMWQSQAFAGALSFGSSVPDEYGTCCCAREVRVLPKPTAAVLIAAAPCTKRRRRISVAMSSPLPWYGLDALRDDGSRSFWSSVLPLRLTINGGRGCPGSRHSAASPHLG